MRVLFYIDAESRISGAMATDLTALEFYQWYRRTYGSSCAVTYMQDMGAQEFQRWQVNDQPTILKRDADQ